MPRYYCDYCDTYLTHDSPSVRKQHNAGYKHKANVRSYYQQFEAQQNQSLIDQKIKEHLGQAAAFQVGAAYNQMRPRLPVLPTPMMPMPGGGQLPMGAPMMAGIRPPVLPRPPTGYAPPPGMQPQMMAPPGAPPAYPGQPMNGLPRPPPTMSSIPTSVPGTAPPPTSGPPSMGMYQPNPAAAAPTAPGGGGGGYDGFNNTSSQALNNGDEASP